VHDGRHARLQQADRKYRLDFLVFWDGHGVAVELDGHDYHKTKQQRTHDASRDVWLQTRGIRTLRFTGSQIHANVDLCVRQQLLDAVRESQARP
jgi:very-short-patch-repair endonuclease